MVSYVNEQYFRQDSIPKQIYITDFNGLSLHNDDIYIEGIELEETLSSEEDLRFGSCICSVLKFTTSDTASSFIDKILGVAYFVNNDSQNPLVVGYYKVVEEKLTADRSKKEIVAKDGIYTINNTDVVNWYDSLNFPMTLKNFRDSFFSFFGLTQKTATLVNDNMTIERSILPNTLSGADVIRAICEINGVFGHWTRDNKFEYITLNNTSVYSITASMGISCEYEDYDSEPIDKVIIRQEDSDVGASYGSGSNPLIVQGNFLVYGMGTAPLTTVAQNLYSVVSVPTYKPCRIECIGNPCVEVGDKITITTKDGTTFDTYVLNRVLRGGQALRDEITAQGNEYRDSEVNSPESQWLQMLGKSNKFERTLEHTISEVSDLSTAVSTVEQTASDLEVQIQSLQEQLDGETQYYERDGEPTMLNFPYWDFTSAIPCDNTIQLSETYTEDMQTGGDQFPHFYYSEQDRKDHMRALCIDLETGDGYRFVLENNVWYWKVIADSDFSILFNQIADLRIDVEGIETDVSNLELEVVDHETRISTNESNITQNADNISAEVSRATNAESNLSGRIDVQATSISAKVDATYGNSSSSFAWQLTSNGFNLYNNGMAIFSATSSGLAIEGAVVAKSGYIGNGSSGFTISNTAIYNGVTSLGDTSHNGIYLGVNGINLGGKFVVNNTGSVTITAGSINLGSNKFTVDNNGNVLATSGKIGGWKLGSNELYLDYNDDTLSHLSGWASSTPNTASYIELGSEQVRLIAQNVKSYDPNGGKVHIEAVGGSGHVFISGYTIDLNASSSVHFAHGGMLNQHQQFTLWTSDNDEPNYTLFYGVQESMWTVSPKYGNGHIALGTPNHKWGQIYSSSAVINTSDRNEKKNITKLNSKILDFVLNLNPVSYKFKTGTRKHFGLIAQDVEDTMAKLGMTDNDFAGFCKDEKTVRVKKTITTESGEEKEIEVDEVVPNEYIYGLRYEEFIAPLIKVVQMQQKEIEELKKKVG